MEERSQGLDTTIASQKSEVEKKEKPLKDFQKEMAKALYFLAYLEEGNEQSEDLKAKLNKDPSCVTPEQLSNFENIW